jgi:hypothetical protein
MAYPGWAVSASFESLLALKTLENFPLGDTEKQFTPTSVPTFVRTPW